MDLRGKVCNAEQRPALRSVDSAELFQGRRELLIRHGTETYRMLITRNGKLILQK